MPTPRKKPLPHLPFNIPSTAKQIAKYRKMRALTQLELSEKTGISQDTISTYEQGRVHLSDEIIIRLALALKITPNDLLGFTNIKQQKNDVSPNLRLTRRMDQINKLPINDQKALLRTIDAYLKGSFSQ